MQTYALDLGRVGYRCDIMICTAYQSKLKQNRDTFSLLQISMCIALDLDIWQFCVGDDGQTN